MAENSDVSVGSGEEQVAKKDSPEALATLKGALPSPTYQLTVLKTKKFLLGYWSPLLYSVVLLVVYLRYGVIFNATLAASALVALPIASYIFRSKEFLRNSVFCISMLLTYEALQGTIGMMVNGSNALSLAPVDLALFGYSFTAAVQNFFASPTVTMIATVFYSFHVYLVVAAMIFFWFACRRVYRGYTYSLILTSYLALITFAVVPTAPPWFSGVAANLLNDGVKMLPNSFSTLEQIFLGAADKLAAFPSLHAAYATLFAAYSIKLDPKIGFISIPLLLGILFSTLYLGQHYLIDLIAGIAYAMLAFFVVEWLLKRSKSEKTVI